MPPPRKRPRLFQLAEHKHTSNPNLHDDDDDDFSDEWDDNLGDGECDEDDEYDEDSEDYEDDENDEYDEYDEGDDRGDDPEDDDGGLGEGDDPDAVLQEQRDRLKVKTNDVFEAIYAKYGQDFTDVGDEIDLETSEIVVNNGHFESIRDGIRDAKDVGEGKVVTEVGREYIECDVPSEANIVTFFGGLVRPQFVKLAQEEYLHSSRTRQMRQVTRDPIVAHRKQPFPGTVSDQSDNDDLRSLEETTSIWAPEIRRKVGRPRKVQQGDLPCFASVYDNNQVLASTRGNTLVRYLLLSYSSANIKE
jgi:hypothetical protein